MKPAPLDFMASRISAPNDWVRRRALAPPATIVLALLLIVVIFNSTIYNRSDPSHASHRGHSNPVWHNAALEQVRNSTLGFQHIFVVVMASRYDRRDALALAAANTGLDITFVDGTKGDDIPEKTLPPHDGLQAGLNTGTLGAWRSHASVLREIVQRNITSALIMESDADWDVRIKDQLIDYALSTRALIQPVAGTTNKYYDTTFPITSPSDRPPQPMIFGSLPQTAPPQTSPYGDGWDILHLGHCGVRSPVLDVPQTWRDLARHIPKGHVIREDDMTVPEPHYLHSFNDEKIQPFRQMRPNVNHTRIVHHSMNFVCSHGFGISQMGARRLLHYTAIRRLDGPFDAMMEHYCQDPDLAGRRGPCIATQPPLMGQHRPAGDITKDFEIKSPWFDGVSGTRKKGFTDNIRYSAQENIFNMAFGYEIDDQYPDTALPHSI